MPDALTCATSDNAVLLTADAVYLLLQRLPDILSNTKLFALRNDLEARGIPNLIDLQNVEIIDYIRFVELTTKFHNIVTW